MFLFKLGLPSITVPTMWILGNVLIKPNAVNLPFEDALYNQYMMMLGMVYGIGFIALLLEIPMRFLLGIVINQLFYPIQSGFNVP